MTLAEYLRAEGATNDVVSWAEPFGDDVSRALRTCPRGDWLLGIAVRLGAERSAVVRAACACARESIDLVTPGDGRPAHALALAEAGVSGDARDSAERDALRAVDEANAPEGAAAAMAALAALRSANEPSDAALAAASTMQAMVLAAGECALVTVASYAAQRCAEHVRAQIDVAALRVPVRGPGA